jgi:hypothetical protein
MIRHPLCNNNGGMPVHIELQNTGDTGARAEISAAIEHALAERSGDWWVSIIGSRANDNWEMIVHGPKGFERSYVLVGAAGEHEPHVIRNLLVRLLPASQM